MLLKNGYRYVYISRKFAMKHGFIPADAAPGHYGYGGLVKYAILSFSGLSNLCNLLVFSQYWQMARHRRSYEDNSLRLPF